MKLPYCFGLTLSLSACFAEFGDDGSGGSGGSTAATTAATGPEDHKDEGSFATSTGGCAPATVNPTLIDQDGFASAQYARSALARGLLPTPGVLRFAEFRSFLLDRGGLVKPEVSLARYQSEVDSVLVAAVRFPVTARPVHLAVVVDPGPEEAGLARVRDVIGAVTGAARPTDVVAVFQWDGQGLARHDSIDDLRLGEDASPTFHWGLLDLPSEFDELLIVSAVTLDFPEAALNVPPGVRGSVAALDLAEDPKFDRVSLARISQAAGGAALYFGAPGEAAPFFAERFDGLFRKAGKVTMEIALPAGIGPLGGGTGSAGANTSGEHSIVGDLPHLAEVHWEGEPHAECDGLLHVRLSQEGAPDVEFSRPWNDLTEPPSGPNEAIVSHLFTGLVGSTALRCAAADSALELAAQAASECLSLSPDGCQLESELESIALDLQVALEPVCASEP